MEPQSKPLDTQDFEKIQKEIATCLNEIDNRYYNSNFNLMEEIANIDRLNKIDDKLDNVIRLLVDKHSKEFFKILGSVREMLKMLEYSKDKLCDAKDAMTNITTTLSNLSTLENSDWKLKSIFCAEVISKLSKTQRIFEIIYDCEVYIQNSKIFDAIKLLKKSAAERLEYDKEFRHFNHLVSISIRFKKIEMEITEKLLQNITKICFFTEDAILNKKVNSLIVYFINYYSKISIDKEIGKPMQKFAYLIHANVKEGIESDQLIKYRQYSFEDQMVNSNVNMNMNENIIDVDSEKKLSSLKYLIKCMQNYENSFEIFYKFSEKIYENLNSLIERTVTMTFDALRDLDTTLMKHDLEGKSEKIKFLLFYQVPLMISFHTLAKIDTLLKNVKSPNESSVKIFGAFEKASYLPLMVYNKIVSPRTECDSESTSDTFESTEFYQAESTLKHKINEMSCSNIDNLPVLYKIYHKFYESALKLCGVKFPRLYQQLITCTSVLYKYYSIKILPKKYFDISTFIYEFDRDVSNFRFIFDLNLKIQKLKDLLVFAFDTAYVEIMKIIKELFNKYYSDTKTFIEKIRKDCIHNNVFNVLYEDLLKLNSSVLKEFIIDLQFKRFEKKNTSVAHTSDSHRFNNILCSFIFEACRLTKQNDSMVLLTRNYKLMELITKFISCSENLVAIGENFVNDLMRQELTSTKMIALLEQASQFKIDNIISATDANDLSSLIMNSFRTFEQLAYEMVKLVLICKIELVCLIVPLVRNISKSEYWLEEPQMTAEYFAISFINEFTMYNNLFQYNLNESEYNFITKDYLLILNNTFISSIKALPSNSINNFGVNLLIRDFEYIKEKLGRWFDFSDPTFQKTIYYFPNYIRILNCNEENIIDEFRKYYDICQYDEEFITPLFKVRTNYRHALNDKERAKIVENIFK